MIISPRIQYNFLKRVAIIPLGHQKNSILIKKKQTATIDDKIKRKLLSMAVAYPVEDLLEMQKTM